MHTHDLPAPLRQGNGIIGCKAGRAFGWQFGRFSVIRIKLVNLDRNISLAGFTGGISRGEWYLFMQSVGYFWWPMLNVASFWSQFQDGLSASERSFALIDADLFKIKNFRVGVSAMMLQQITLGGAMIALPLYLQVTLEYNAMQAGLSLAPLSLTMFAIAVLAGKRTAKRRPAEIIRLGFALAFVGMAIVVPVIPRGESGWALLIPLLIAGVGLGLLVSQLNNYILGPIEEERVSEAAGVNSAGQSFGLSFGLALGGGILLAVLSFGFVSLTESSDVIPPADQELISTALEDNAQLVSTTQLEEQLASQPDDIVDEIVSINTDAGNLALQVAMLVPILACLLGFVNSFRMMRLPDFTPSEAAEGLLGG